MEENFFSDSVYKFIQPVRKFKANDPYYFEVDNIPINQLEQNCLWLRDQLSKIDKTGLKTVKRGDIEELKPYVTGSDRTVRVKPGRYTSRINDAVIKNPLAFIQQVIGFNVGEVTAWEAALPNPGQFSGNANQLLQNLLNNFKSNLASNSLGLNGLETRVFTKPLFNDDTPVNNSGNIFINQGGFLTYNSASTGTKSNISPVVIANAIVWAKSLNSNTWSSLIQTFDQFNTSVGYSEIPLTESILIKKWRGIARLAIVDVPEELTIEIPKFDAGDFSYINESGTEVSVPGVISRIDMVFIYSKPVDMSSTTILTNSGAKTITSPQLGVIQGAGIKVNYQGKNNPVEGFIQNPGSNHKILASPGDQFNSNIGFTATSANDLVYNIRGSFPAPDDILNLAPLLSEKIESSSPDLIGQTILPICYVWVQNGSEVIIGPDIIDIRPFLRSAELTYNERAGLAAAVPQISLANPVVGKAQLEENLYKTNKLLQGQIDSLKLDVEVLPSKLTSILATGYVFGGWAFGPEGTLYNYYKKNQLSDSQTKEFIRSKYGYSNSSKPIEIPLYPDWDLADWCVLNSLPDKGKYPADRWGHFKGYHNTKEAFAAGCFAEKVNETGLNDLNQSPLQIDKFYNLFGAGNFSFIKKTIKFNRPSWMLDYHINYNFLNSVPLQGGSNDEEKIDGGIIGSWVEKGFDTFTIYIAARPVNAYVTDNAVDYTWPLGKFPRINENPTKYRSLQALAMIGVPVMDLADASTKIIPKPEFTLFPSPNYDIGLWKMGVAFYPTITWEFVGISAANADYHYGNLNASMSSGGGLSISLKGAFQLDNI